MSKYLSVPESDAGLTRYLAEVRKFPMLTLEEEQSLANRWRDEGDRTAAHKLVTSHLRLVAKIALGFRGYGLPVSELIAEGNIGMMQAVKRFEPARGFRLATYAMWWIRAAIQEYILRSWSLVKIGTTSAQKKLFFNLRRLKAKVSAYEDGDLAPETVTNIARELMVEEREVVDMNRRLSGGDSSLNSPLRTDGVADGEWMDLLEDTGQNPEELAGHTEELNLRNQWLQEALSRLGERERMIVENRKLADPPRTLEELSGVLGVSRERVRQVEARALEKLEKYVHEAASRFAPAI